eukprot:758421-Hanusia_phi.AAC.4
MKDGDDLRLVHPRLHHELEAFRAQEYVVVVPVGFAGISSGRTVPDVTAAIPLATMWQPRDGAARLRMMQSRTESCSLLGFSLVPDTPTEPMARVLDRGPY